MSALINKVRLSLESNQLQHNMVEDVLNLTLVSCVVAVIWLSIAQI